MHKLLIIADKNIIEQLEMSLKEKFTGLKIYKSKDTYLEIMDESVSKASAIQFLCDKMKISLHQVVSFGDNYNDLDMLLLTGKGFAMANSAKGVLESISTHTLSNEIIERKKDDDKSRNHGLFSYFKRYSKKRYCTSCK